MGATWESELRYLDAPTAGLTERFDSTLGRPLDNSLPRGLHAADLTPQRAHFRRLTERTPCTAVIVWLFGSQASGRAQADSDTDLLVFGPPGLKAAMRTAHSRQAASTAWGVVNGDDLKDPWQAKGGSLSRWNWVLKSPLTPSM